MIGKKDLTIRLFSGTYCCRADQLMTLVSDPEELSCLSGYSKEELDHICKDGFLGLIEDKAREGFCREVRVQLQRSDDIECLIPMKRKDGSKKWLLNRARKILSEEGEEFLCGILVDATGSKCSFDKEKEVLNVLQEQVQRDSLTEIYNACISRKLAEEYLYTYGKGKSCALLIIDLDDFKLINDRYGHMFGDAVLKQTAKSISKLFRANDVVGRIGGDEFMVLMKDISDRQIVKKRCRQLNEMLKLVFEEQLGENAPSCSIGVGFSPEHGQSYFSLFCCADQALYRAKEQGRQQFVFYEKEECGPVREKSAMQYANYDIDVLRGCLE